MIRFVGLIAISILTLLSGEVSFFDLWDSSWNPLLQERLPRLIVLLTTGASLAVAGAVTQSLFQNPLASPSVLGVTAGGSLAVFIPFSFGLAVMYPVTVPIATVVGSLFTLLIVYTIAKHRGRVLLHHLILTGIAASTLLLTAQSTLTYLLRHNWEVSQLLVEWQAGTSFHRSWQHVHMQLPLALIGLTGCWHYRNELNILALGEEEAKNLGVAVDTIRFRLFLCIALLAGGAMAAIGSIAFFGLILPHLIRTLKGADNCTIIPLSGVYGSVCLATLDYTLRFFSIYSITLENISALFGGCFFFYLLIQAKKTDATFQTC